MKRLLVKNSPNNYRSLESFSNPHAKVPTRERLVAAGAVDLTDNSIEVDLGNGWVKAVPKDPTKLIK